MLLALALMAQDVTVNADANQAVTCGHAVVASRPAGGAPSGTTMLQAVYFMMAAAQADPVPGKRFLERTTDIAPLIFKEDKQSPAQFAATLTACDKRYPLARSTAPAKLPTDSFQRDLICAAASSYAFGILQGAGVTAKVDEYQRIQQGFLTRIPDTLLAERGIKDSDGIVGAMDNALASTTRIGNLETILVACARELDGK